MAEPINPLFEDEKEFLERQKLEYERALLGEVEEIKEKTQQIGKYVAIGAGLLGGVWLLSKAFGGPGKSASRHDRELSEGQRNRRKVRALRKGYAADDLDMPDDLGLSSGHQADRGFQAPASARAANAPDVYHTDEADSDPFQPMTYQSARPLPAMQYQARRNEKDADDLNHSSTIMADAFRSFLQSDTGKMLVAQATAVLMAVVAKKVGDYLPMFKNPDLAASPSPEPETRDIDFTFHNDDANAPHQSL